MIRYALLANAIVLASLLAIAPPATAEETKCTGTIGAVALDNIFVPDGASCTLNGTRANGNIVVGTGALLRARGVSINGNIQAEGARSVFIQGNSTVGGSVQIVQGGAARVESARITGDLYFNSNQSPIEANGNRVGGNLQAFQNLGGTTVTGNMIKGNLQCKENTPAPTGSGNRASSKEDQCSRL